jgi:tRNA A-37 threonylcarbamoyl transferase component Bud32/WD40 repeat protein
MSTDSSDGAPDRPPAEVTNHPVQVASEVKSPDRTVTIVSEPPNASEPETYDSPGLVDVSQLPVVDPAQFTVSGELARGGIGRVLKARERLLGRTIAIKELLETSKRASSRFLREAAITARLQHPGIVPIHEAGRWPTGQPFYSMKLISGKTLKDAIQASDGFADRLALLPHVTAVADAIAYAHSEGVVHRDLKPANVVIGPYGETVVIDWGMAKDMRSVRSDETSCTDAADHRRPESSELTVTGAVIGTPAYMPPEQAAGHPVDERADVYALGSMLYHVLTGTMPYPRSSLYETLARVRNEVPVPIEQREARVPPELAAIVSKAMARSSGERYPTAKGLADDLRRFQTGQLVSAHVYRPRTLLVRWLRRYRSQLAVAGVAMLTLMVLSAVGVGNIVAARNRARAAQDLAEQRAQRLEVSERAARALANASLLSEAARTLPQDPAKAMAVLSRYPSDGDDWGLAARLAIDAVHVGLPTAVIAVGNRAVVTCAPRGNLMAVATDKEVSIRKTGDPSSIATWPFPLAPRDSFIGIKWLAGDGFLVATHLGGVTRFRLGAPPRKLTESPGYLVDFDVSEDGERFLSGWQDGTVRIDDIGGRTGRALYRQPGGIAGVKLFDGTAFSIGNDGRLRSRSLDDRQGPERTSPIIDPAGLNSLAVRRVATGHEIVVGSVSGMVQPVDPASLRPGSLIRHFGARILTADWLLGGDDLVVVTNDEVVRRVSSRGTRELVIGTGDLVLPTPDREWLVIAGLDGSVTWFHPATAWRRTFKTHESRLIDFSLSAERELVTIGEDGTLRTWPRSVVPTRLYKLDGVGGTIDTFPGRDTFVIASDRGQIQLCDPSGSCRAARADRAAQLLVRLGADADPIAAIDLAAGHIYAYDRDLKRLGRMSAGEGLSDVRVSGSRLLAVTETGALLFGTLPDGSLHRRTMASDCPQVARARWLPGMRVLVGCSNGRVLVFDSLEDDAPPRFASDVSTMEPAPSLIGVGGLADGSVLTLSSKGNVYRSGPAGPAVTRMRACDGTSRMLYEANDANLYASDCDSHVTVFSADGSRESPALGRPRVLDIDANAASHRVIVGLEHNLSVWDYDEGRTTGVTSVMPVYNVEAFDARRRTLVLAASGIGSVQLWDFTDAALVPTDRSRLQKWIREIGGRFNPLSEHHI